MPSGSILSAVEPDAEAVEGSEPEAAPPTIAILPRQRAAGQLDDGPAKRFGRERHGLAMDHVQPRPLRLAPPDEGERPAPTAARRGDPPGRAAPRGWGAGTGSWAGGTQLRSRRKGPGEALVAITTRRASMLPVAVRTRTPSRRRSRPVTADPSWIRAPSSGATRSRPQHNRAGSTRP